MTLNVAETVRKMMGWCPHPNVFVTKRTLITLPSDEFLNNEKDKGKMVDPVKMGWGNRYRNIVLLTTLVGIVGFGVNVLILTFSFDHILCFFPSLCQRYIKTLPRRKPLATPKDNSQSILPSIKLLKRAENMNTDTAITIPCLIVFICSPLLQHLPRKKMLPLQSMSSYFSAPSKPLQKTGSRQLKRNLN